MPDDALIEKLKARVPDDFSRDLLQGALDALTQKNVNTRVQHFAVSLRELSDYLLKQMAAYDEAIGAFINETIDSLDLIAGRYETGGVLTDEMRVLSLDGDSVGYEITGSVDVTLHYGSGSDAATIEENFPFTCTTGALVAEPFKLLTKETEMRVDTSSWHGQPEEDDGS